MRLPLLPRLCLAGALLTVALRAADAPPSLGQIKAEVVIGNVDAISHADQYVTPLHNDDLLSQGYTIKTGAEASAVLVFSNGAVVRLAAETELSIDAFLQDPFPGDQLDVGKLAQEPTGSSTRLRLVRGELAGQIVKLHAGSSHLITTPVGAAGIRGTTFRHVYRVNPNGNAVFSSATDEGVVRFTALDGQSAVIGAATEITGRARLGRRAGVQFTTHAITRRSKVVIDHHVRVMQAARQRVIFRRADRPARPTLRRDALARREANDDFKDIDREDQERAKAAKPAPPPKAPAKKKA